jgi:hypothetical protein
MMNAKVRSWCGFAAGTATVILLTLILNSVNAQPAHAAGCANEAVRADRGSAGLTLPECRAYELVSPGSTPLVASGGSQGLPADVLYGARAADDGNAMAYFGYYPFPGALSSGRYFRSRRSDAGWSLEAMVPQTAPGAAIPLICENTELNYSEDLSASLISLGHDRAEEGYAEGGFCEQPQESVVPGEPHGFTNLLRRGTPTAPYELVNQTQTTASAANAQFQDASADLSHIVFGENSELTPEAPPGYDLYLWVNGALRLVTFLPNGAPVRGDLVAATRHNGGDGAFANGRGGRATGAAPFSHAMSTNGERIFFYAEGNLYLRENAAQPAAGNPDCRLSEPGLACTVQIDRTEGPGLSGGGEFLYASADGNRVFFKDESRLTSPSSAAPGKPAIYEYDVETHSLADRSVGAATGADVLGFSGAAEDGSRLYFVAKESLTGAQQNALGEAAQSGEPNLYLLENGTLIFVATLDSSADRSAWGYEFSLGLEERLISPEDLILATRTSPDGRFFAFNSARGLTGDPGGTTQIFLYDALSRQLVCASCLPGGAAPPGPSAVPAKVKTAESDSPGYLPRALTDQGQLFFTTLQGLLPTDTNGVADVYEYRQGALSLISDGGGTGPSFFFDASAGGGNVFFATTDPLVRSDTDNALSLYDARVEGGFAEGPSPAPPCVGESCRSGASAVPDSSPPATTTVAGPGNVAPPKKCKQGRVLRQGKCVKKANRQKHKPHKAKPKHKTGHGKKKGPRR